MLQLASEGILTPEELGWFPGSLVLGQVLGILVGPLLADLVIALAIRMAMDFNKLQYLYYLLSYLVIAFKGRRLTMFFRWVED